jgi:hypothetical protein
MSGEQAKKGQPTKFITKPIADPRYVQSPKAEFRKLNFPVPADQTEKDLFLIVLDKDLVNAGKEDKHDNRYQIYLGRSKTFKRGEGPDYYNMLVPVIPRCHATADRDPAQAVEVPEGWLYIIRQFTNPLTGDSKPELWRELYSDGLGNFNDVNLNRFEGKDQRKATGQSGSRIIVPHCIDKQDHQLWMAYSEVQWSWNRVQSMKQDSKLREQRMHKLDLSDCLDNFAKSGYKSPSPPKKPGGQQDKLEIRNVSGPALLYNLKSAPDPESRDLAKDFQDAIPVVYLDNPVGIAKSLATKYQKQWATLTHYLEELRALSDFFNEQAKKPGPLTPTWSTNTPFSKDHGRPERFFEAAALANRYFFSKISKEIPPGVKDKVAYKKRLAEIEEQFLKYQNKLDKPAIEVALNVAYRSEIRKKLVQARNHLVDFLEKELAAVKPEKSGGETQDPPLVQALDDYFTLTPLTNKDKKENKTDPATGESTPVWRDNYLDGWGAVYDILAALAKHEYSLDTHLEANPPDGWQWRRDNRAFELMLNLVDPQGGNPLHDRLFPKAAANAPLKFDAAPVKDNATAFKKQHLGNFEALKRRDPEIINGLSRFGTNFSELMAMRDDKDPAYEKRLERVRHSVLRLVDSVVGLQLEETEISLAELIARTKKQLEESKNGGVTGSKAFIKFAGFLQKSIDTAEKFPEKSLPGSAQFRRIRVRVIRATNTQSTQRLLHDLSDPKLVSSGLGGFLSLIEIHNFTQTLKAFTSNKNDDRNWELFAPLAAGFLQLPAAIKDVKDSVEALAKAGQGGAKAAAQGAFARKGTAQVGVGAGLIKKANLVGNLIDMGVTLSSLTENLAQNDDAAIADAIGFTGAVLGLIATAFSIPVLGWVAGLVGLAAWLAKAYLFTEDSPVEMWLANCPFARGDQYHEAFRYKRSTTIKKIKDAKGNWVDTACTVHRYDNFEFLVDSAGILVHAGPSFYHVPVQHFRVAPDGTVVLKAGKWYDLPMNKWHEIPADTHVATIGQPFTMHPLLETTEKKKPKKKPQLKPTDKTVHDVRSCHQGMATFKETPAEKWHADPHQAYLALADAIYRPRITLTKVTDRTVRCVLKISLPFYLPGKSKLHMDFKDKLGRETKFHIPDDPDSIKGLEVGPGEYEISRQLLAGAIRTFTAKVRLDLYGDHTVELPCEPLFSGSDIKTEIDKNTAKGVQDKSETKWIVVEKQVANTIIY